MEERTERFVFSEFHQAVKESERLKLLMEKEGVTICGGYSQGVVESTTIHVFCGIEKLAEFYNKDLDCTPRDGAYTSIKSFTADGVKYFQLDNFKKEKVPMNVEIMSVSDDLFKEGDNGK